MPCVSSHVLIRDRSRALLPVVHPARAARLMNSSRLTGSNKRMRRYSCTLLMIASFMGTSRVLACLSKISAAEASVLGASSASISECTSASEDASDGGPAASLRRRGRALVGDVRRWCVLLSKEREAICSSSAGSLLERPCERRAAGMAPRYCKSESLESPADGAAGEESESLMQIGFGTFEAFGGHRTVS